MSAFDKAWKVLKNEVFKPTFKVEHGPKGMYSVINWDDGKSLFLDGDSQKHVMNAMADIHEASDMPDEQERHSLMERHFGIGSDYHGIADEGPSEHYIPDDPWKVPDDADAEYARDI